LQTRSAREIWEAALGELQIQVNKSNYRTWLEKTVGLGYQNNHFVVGVPNTFAAEYLDKNQRSLIEKTLIGLIGRDIEVLFQVDAGNQYAPNSSVCRQDTSPATSGTSKLNSKYTFDSFIVGDCNRLAHAASLNVAENPGNTYNPLLICGGVGVGKTHLLHAIGHAALSKNIAALYVSTEQFTNEFVHAVREKKTKEFQSKFRNVDMLLIDDINFIIGKGQTEESFFHTFNALYNANRQIVVTSDCPPKCMPQIEEHLRSRLEWGLIADIQPPDFETRLAILQARAKHEKVNITPDILEFIAHRIRQNIRELEGSLNRVIAYSKLMRVLLTPELAEKALEDIASKKPRNDTITPELIVEAVASSFQLSTIDLKGRKRDNEISLARQVAMYLIRQKTDFSLDQIGKEVGGRSPATVSHSYTKIGNEMNNSPYLTRKIKDIQNELNTREKD